MRFEFRKSSYSTGGGSGTCVEVATNVPGVRAIRDSKAPDEGHLLVDPGKFTAFIDQLKRGHLD